MKADEIIAHLGLEKHPEGGWYKQIYVAKGIISLEVLPPKFSTDKTYATSIYYLLKNGEKSVFHKLKQDELWHYYHGTPIFLHSINKNGEYNKISIGIDFAAGQVPFYALEAGTIFAAEMQHEGEYNLSGCTVTPGFEFSDMTILKRQELLDKFPNFEEIIYRFTQE